MATAVDEPVVSVIYRGFLLQPALSIDLTTVTLITYQVKASADGINYSSWNTVGVVASVTSFNFIHDSLYNTVYYRYRCQLTYADGTVSDWSDEAIPGNGNLPPSPDLPVPSVDAVASNLGTVSSGYMRGVVFETSRNYPKVRFDPNGFYCINNNSTPVLIDAYTGSLTLTGSVLVGGTITGSLIRTATPPGPRVEIGTGVVGYKTGNTSLWALDGLGGVKLRTGSDTRSGAISGDTISWVYDTIAATPVTASQIFGSDTVAGSSGSGLTLTANATLASNRSQLLLTAYGDVLTTLSSICIKSGMLTTDNSVTLIASAANRTLLAGDQTSSYHQLTAVQNIQWDGPYYWQAGAIGAGATLTKTYTHSYGNGNYSVVPVVIEYSGSNGGISITYNRNTNSVVLCIRNNHTATLNCDVEFWLIKRPGGATIV